MSLFLPSRVLELDEIKAQLLLNKCSGDEIWSIQRCVDEGVPERWIDELKNAFESGFDSDRNTIYVDEHVINQYYGVPDLQLAYKCAEFLGIDWQSATQFAIGRRAEVRSLKEALEEM